MKRKTAVGVVLLLLVSLFAGCASQSPSGAAGDERTKVRVAALKGPTAMGMVKMMDEAESAEEGNDYEFSVIPAIDEITPKLVRGELDISAVPANLSSVLYNNSDGLVQVLAINTLGVLYMVESGETVSSVEDLRGRTIYASGKGATPEYALNYILRENGIDPDRDVTIEYKSEHTECVAALIQHEGAIAMLPQPFVTTAQAQNEGIRIALDLTKEWDAIQPGEGGSSLLTGVVVARREFVEQNPGAVEEFMEQYSRSVQWVNANTDEAAALIAGYDIVPEAVAKKALPYCNIVFIEGDDMAAKLEGYLSVLLEQNPQSVGGALPDEAFYYKK